MGIGFKLRTTYFDTMINYHQSQKLKLIENDVFNDLTIISSMPKTM